MTEQRLTDLPELVDLLRCELVEQVGPNAFDVTRGGIRQHREACVGEYGERSAAVGGAVLATYPTGLLQPGDGVGQPAAGGE